MIQIIKKKIAKFFELFKYKYRKFSKNSFVNNRIFPKSAKFQRVYKYHPFQRVNINFELVEIWLDIKAKYTKTVNFALLRNDSLDLIDLIIQQSFSEEELKNIICVEQNVTGFQMPMFDFNKPIDFVLMNKNNQNLLAVFITEESKKIDEHTNDFGHRHSDCLAWMLDVLLQYEDCMNKNAIITNGVDYQLVSLNENKEIIHSTMLRLDQENDDQAFIQLKEIAGMFRYPLIRFKNELLLDRFLKDYHEKSR